MGESRHDGLTIPGRVVLAREPPFALGSLRVIPALRQVERRSERETLEPRVMQVLVFLARAGGAIVTRDDLIEACWDGRIVSENAINRVISRVRQLGEAFSGAFAVETITKVGYRLVVSGRAEPQALVAETASGRLTRRFVVAGSAVLLAGGSTGAWWLRVHRPAPARAQAEMLVHKGKELAFGLLPQSDEQARAYFREATRIDPDYAEAWSQLALVEDDPARIRSAAKRALELDANNAAAQTALLQLEPYFGYWGSFEAQCRALGRKYPDQTRLFMYLGELLSDVGRCRDAIAAYATVTRQDPYRPVAYYKLATAMWSAGRIQDAEDLLDRAMVEWPRHSALWTTRFRMLAFGGSPRSALAMFNDAEARPLDLDETAWAPTIATVRAMASELPRDLGLAAAANLDAAERSPTDIHMFATNLVNLGHIDEAFELLDDFFARGRHAVTLPTAALRNWRPTAFLFYPSTAALREDSRFGRLVAELGLEGYWRAANVQPDYRRFG